jgi:hypothetical protein
MPNKQLILSSPLESQADLLEKFGALHLKGLCSQSQASSMVSTLRKYIPCAVRLYSRTPKGTMYLNVLGNNASMFTISPRAKIALTLDLSDD